MLLGRPWPHDMDVIPSIVHDILKFEYQDEVHIVLGYPKLYAFCNVVDFEEFTMTFPRYEIEPLEQTATRENVEK